MWGEVATEGRECPPNHHRGGALLGPEMTSCENHFYTGVVGLVHGGKNFLCRDPSLKKKSGGKEVTIRGTPLSLRDRGGRRSA